MFSWLLTYGIPLYTVIPQMFVILQTSEGLPSWVGCGVLRRTTLREGKNSESLGIPYLSLYTMIYLRFSDGWDMCAGSKDLKSCLVIESSKAHLSPTIRGSECDHEEALWNTSRPLPSQDNFRLLFDGWVFSLLLHFTLLNFPSCCW